MIITLETLLFALSGLIIGIFCGYQFSIYRYRKGVEDGIIYERALLVKRLHSADERVSQSFSEEELKALSNVSKR